MRIGLDTPMNRRRLIVVVTALVCFLIPAPFIISYLNSMESSPIKNFTGIQVTWRSVTAIKVRYKKITKIPIRYTHSSRINVSYKDLSVIKVTYRNAADSLSDDPRFPQVRLRNATFRVQPRLVN
ncbi:MAG: hypothetical protein JWM80_1923 [Cyanobacteria bacterium RYN_339]|nr:hypothetical protein [Cyanobacteria bacterium RYN_339]